MTQPATTASYQPPVVPPNSNNAAAVVAPVKVRLDRLEQAVFLQTIQSDTTLERVANLEMVLLGQTQSGTISTRLSALEQEMVDISRIVLLEQELRINPSQQGSLLERLGALESELWGGNATGPLSVRLQMLEEQAASLERIVRLEQELAINPGQQGSRLDRLAALEQELFGENYAGTTFLSRMLRLEAELLG